MITVIWTKKTKNALTTYGPPEPLGEALKANIHTIFTKQPEVQCGWDIIIATHPIGGNKNLQERLGRMSPDAESDSSTAYFRFKQVNKINCHPSSRT